MRKVLALISIIALLFAGSAMAQDPFNASIITIANEISSTISTTATYTTPVSITASSGSNNQKRIYGTGGVLFYVYDAHAMTYGGAYGTLVVQTSADGSTWWDRYSIQCSGITSNQSAIYLASTYGPPGAMFRVKKTSSAGSTSVTYKIKAFLWNAE